MPFTRAINWDEMLPPDANNILGLQEKFPILYHTDLLYLYKTTQNPLQSLKNPPNTQKFPSFL